MTIVERKTRYISLIKLRTKQTADVIAGFNPFYKRYGQGVRTITADNGAEFDLSHGAFSFRGKNAQFRPRITTQSAIISAEY